jgi:hypothetical protein
LLKRLKANPFDLPWVQMRIDSRVLSGRATYMCLIGMKYDDDQGYASSILAGTPRRTELGRVR